MTDFKAIIVLVDDPVDVIGRLLCGVDVFRPGGDELDRPFTGEKNFHQRGQDRPHRITDFREYDLRATGLLVTERLAVVVVGRLRALRGDVLRPRLCCGRLLQHIAF